MTEHIKTRHKIKNIADLKTFDELLSISTLSEKDRQILRMHYLEEKDFRYISDYLGFSESAIKKRHRKALAKLGKLL